MVTKKKQKSERQQEVLLGLVELFLLTGKAVGSNTLKESGFDHISSATIRNYFAKLEEEGLLKQQHSSGGRIPTAAAYKLFAKHHLESKEVSEEEFKVMKKELDQDTREIASYLQSASELLSDLTQGAVFLSSPRFDQDLVTDIKIVKIDPKRCLVVIVTDFGLIKTEVLHTPKKLSSFSLKRLESYFRFRLSGLDRPKLNAEEEEIGANFYSEILMRHIVGYSNFSAEDIYKTGFSKLIRFPEFRDAMVLASGLSIFENSSYMRGLLSSCVKSEGLKVWIGDDISSAAQSSIIAAPYFIHGKAVGAIAILGPIRMPYPKLFGILRKFSEVLSEALTRNLYKYKITYRQPETLKIIDQTGE
ncbi:heat-inducible transcriptional repressor HrcA [Candidatus Neptunochlamydia vexilliferae]|nr:heat-inducible transcriptional repressor HrcA [Candidatus Neptunochlamydia vexilliferae]